MSSFFIQADSFSQRCWLYFTSESSDEKHPFWLLGLLRLWFSYANGHTSWPPGLGQGGDGGDANNDPLSQTLPVLSFNCHLFLIGIVTTGEVYLHSPSASNGGDSAGSFQSIAKHIVIVDLHNNATWSALLSQWCGRGLWGLRCRKVKWLS